MTVRVFLHGQLGRHQLDVDARSARDAIEALGSQLRPFENLPLGARPVLRVIGFPTRDAIEAPLPVGIAELHLVPAMLGGGGKFGSFIVAGLLLVVSAFAPPGLQQSLWAAAATVAAGGVVNLFMPTPKASTGGPQDPAASKYFGAQGNTVAIGTPIGIAYGQVPRYGHVLALNVDAQDIVRGTFPVTP